MNVVKDTIAVCGGIPHAACGANHGGSGIDVVPTPKISVSTASISVSAPAVGPAWAQPVFTRSTTPVPLKAGRSPAVSGTCFQHSDSGTPIWALQLWRFSFSALVLML